MKIIYLIIGAALLTITGIGIFRQYNRPETAAIVSFEECAKAGYPIMESYPPRCKTPDGKIFMEDIGNELEKSDLIRVSIPRPNQEIKSPLIIEGEARGYWFFEASFPIRLFDADNKEIAIVVAAAQSDWMVTDFVPFKATLIFETPATPTGTLVFEKDNPSGLPENTDELRMPIKFGVAGADETTAPESGVEGKILIGPRCPVMRVEDKNCEDAPYPTSIEIFSKNASEPFRIIETDGEGNFKIALEPGVYSLKPKGGNPFPACSKKEVLISTGQFQGIIISCDTGIR